jgi:hypothetical protein
MDVGEIRLAWRSEVPGKAVYPLYSISERVDDEALLCVWSLRAAFFNFVSKSDDGMFS